MSLSRAAILLCVILAAGMQASLAQAVRNGLGDATTIISPARTLSSTGNANEIGNFSNSSLTQDTGEFVTRHIRSGNASGIGGSFIGTTNVTSESSPARIGSIPLSAVRALIPTAGANVGPTDLYSQSLSKPVTTALPAITPDISSRWSAAAPLLDNSNSSSIDFFVGRSGAHQSRTFSNTMGVPSFDGF
jgi:hypothetical protein